ncbi:hypothetical protein D5S17_35615 [Pseudonocardiaceae bacterium YIM PH 21723]|nr:hypothetical protein D5S17_35615 [Pseudonocardiaceae bacterium YIM PH 21723]
MPAKAQRAMATSTMDGVDTTLLRVLEDSANDPQAVTEPETFAELTRMVFQRSEVTDENLRAAIADWWYQHMPTQPSPELLSELGEYFDQQAVRDFANRASYQYPTKSMSQASALPTVTTDLGLNTTAANHSSTPVGQWNRGLTRS